MVVLFPYITEIAGPGLMASNLHMERQRQVNFWIALWLTGLKVGTLSCSKV